MQTTFSINRALRNLTDHLLSQARENTDVLEIMESVISVAFGIIGLEVVGYAIWVNLFSASEPSPSSILNWSAGNVICLAGVLIVAISGVLSLRRNEDDGEL